MPLPNDVSWEIQLFFWLLLTIIVGLIGLSVFFIKRYIDRTDKKFDLVLETVNAHDRILSKSSDRIATSAFNLTQFNNKFQQETTEELEKLKTVVAAIQKYLHDVSLTVNDVALKTIKMSESLEKSETSLANYSRIITATADAVVSQRKKIERQEEMIETVKKEIGRLTIIGHKKKDEN